MEKKLEQDKLELDELDSEPEEEEDPITNRTPDTIINTDSNQDQLSLELPNGFKLSLASLKFNISQLCGMALEMYDKFKEKQERK